MPNTYFNLTSPLARFTTADAERLNATLKSVEAGFDKLPSVQELSQGTRNYSVATNVGNAYSITVPLTFISYPVGMEVAFQAGAANAAPGPATLNVNGIGPATIKRFDNANLLEGDIRATSINTVRFDGAAFRLTSMHGGTEALASTSATNAAASAASASTSASQALSSKNSAAASEATATSSANTAVAVLSGSRFGIRNVILNPLFWLTNPIGLVMSGTYAAGILIRDRWRAGPTGVTFSIANTIMTITAGSVYQVVQGRNLMLSGTYTLSWIGTAPATINNVPVSNGGQVTLTGAQHTTISFGVGTFSQPQLEFSAIKTPFEIRPTDYDIMACAQYYQKSYEMETAPGTAGSGAVGYHVSLAQTQYNLCQGYIQFSTPMRGTPAITIYSISTGLAGAVYDTVPLWDIPATISLSSYKGFHVSSPPGDFTSGSFIDFHWVADAEL